MFQHFRIFQNASAVLETKKSHFSQVVASPAPSPRRQGIGSSPSPNSWTIVNGQSSQNFTQTVQKSSPPQKLKFPKKRFDIIVKSPQIQREFVLAVYPHHTPAQLEDVIEEKTGLDFAHFQWGREGNLQKNIEIS